MFICIKNIMIKNWGVGKSLSTHPEHTLTMDGGSAGNAGSGLPVLYILCIRAPPSLAPCDIRPPWMAEVQVMLGAITCPYILYIYAPPSR